MAETMMWVAIMFGIVILTYLLVDHVEFKMRQKREKERIDLRWDHNKVWPEDNRYTKDQPLTEWERELAEGRDPGRG